MDNFPYGAHDDGIDMLSYGFRDVLQSQTIKAILSTFSPQKHIDLYGDRHRSLHGGTSWMSR